MEEFKDKSFESIPAKKYDPFDWSKYLKGLAITILVIGIIVTIILIFTICFDRDPGLWRSEVKFSLTGFAITISILLFSIFTHATFCWFSEVLKRLDK